MPKPHLRPRGSTELGNHIRLLWGLSEVIYLCVTPSMGPCTSDIYRVTVAFLLLFLLLLLHFLQLLVLFRYFDCNHHPFLKDLRFSIKRNRLLQDRGITAVKEQSPCTFRMGSIWVCRGREAGCPTENRGRGGHHCPTPCYCPFQIILFKLLCKTSFLSAVHTSSRKEKRNSNRRGKKRKQMNKFSCIERARSLGWKASPIPVRTRARD